LYAKKEWQELAVKLSKLPISKANPRAFGRFMLAGRWMLISIIKAELCCLNIKKIFRLKKKLVFAGLYDRLEIWDETVWNKYKHGTEKKNADIAEALGELGV